jgi:ADP-ribosylglycohydrolase
MATKDKTASADAAADRVAGAVMGAFIGDALGLGPHWYYDLAEMRRDYGAWISGYTAPRPGRYHEGLLAGDLSQTGFIMKLLLESLAEKGGYDEEDFTFRLDTQLLARMDGTPYSGPGGYTNQSIRETYASRVVQRRPWGETGGWADTSEAAERIAILAARYAFTPYRAAAVSARNCRLTQIDPSIVSQSVAFGCVVAALVRGAALDESLSDSLREMVKRAELPFTHAVLAEERGQAGGRPPAPSDSLPYPDALLLPSYCAAAAHDPGIRIDPAWRAAIVHGLPCAVNFLLPAAYYLAARFPGDFESAVLYALNGGGQNMSRACLTGALAGAQAGLSAIPARFIQGLRDGDALLALSRRVAETAAAALPGESLDRLPAPRPTDGGC